MRRFVVTLIVAFTATFAFGQVSMESIGFTPAADGGAKEVQKPDAVEVDAEAKTVSAETMQDGINAAVKDIQTNVDGGASRIIKTKSGVGYVAVGSSGYGDPAQLANPTAAKMSKRLAYVTALQRAKVELAKFLGEMTLESKQALKETLKTTIDDKTDQTEISQDNEESINRAVSMVLRGYVVYDVVDDEEEHSVRVSIVTSPATRGEVKRLSNGAMEAKSIAAGVQHVLTEINKGVVPPVGGRVIFVPQTGETAFIGFGSAVVPTSANATIQSRLKETAKKFASARAEAALCQNIVGDEFQWSNGLSETSASSQSDAAGEQTANLTADIKKQSEDDPLNKDNEKDIAEMNKVKDAFKASMSDSEEFKSAFSGKIPMGTNSKSWLGDDGWAYSFCCYIPSSANIAADVKRKLETAQIVKPIAAVDSSDEPKAEVKKLGKGATGQVSKDDDL